MYMYLILNRYKHLKFVGFERKNKKPRNHSALVQTNLMYEVIHHSCCSNCFILI